MLFLQFRSSNGNHKKLPLLRMGILGFGPRTEMEFKQTLDVYRSIDKVKVVDEAQVSLYEKLGELRRSSLFKSLKNAGSHTSFHLPGVWVDYR